MPWQEDVSQKNMGLNPSNGATHKKNTMTLIIFPRSESENQKAAAAATSPFIPLLLLFLIEEPGICQTTIAINLALTCFRGLPTFSVGAVFEKSDQRLSQAGARSKESNSQWQEKEKLLLKSTVVILNSIDLLCS